MSGSDNDDDDDDNEDDPDGDTPDSGVNNTEDNNNDDDDTSERLSTSMMLSDLDREVEIFQSQQENDNKVLNRLMLPRRIGSAISSTVSAFAYTFLIGTFVLNLFGYDWVHDGSLRIGTLEERAFRNEVVKMNRQQRDEQKQQQRRQETRKTQQQRLLPEEEEQQRQQQSPSDMP